MSALWSRQPRLPGRPRPNGALIQAAGVFAGETGTKSACCRPLPGAPTAHSRRKDKNLVRLLRCSPQCCHISFPVSLPPVSVSSVLSPSSLVFNSLILSVCVCPWTFPQRCTNAMPEPCLLIIALCKMGLFCFPSSSDPLCHLRTRLPALSLRAAAALPA